MSYTSNHKSWYRLCKNNFRCQNKTKRVSLQVWCVPLVIPLMMSREKKFAHCGVFTVTFDHYSLLKLNCFRIRVYVKQRKQLCSYLKEDLNLSMLPAVFKGDLHAISNNMLYLVTFQARHEKLFSLSLIAICMNFNQKNKDNVTLNSANVSRIR